MINILKKHACKRIMQYFKLLTDIPTKCIYRVATIKSLKFEINTSLFEDLFLIISSPFTFHPKN